MESEKGKINIKAVDWENMKIAYNIETLLLLRYTHDLHRNNRQEKNKPNIYHIKRKYNRTMGNLLRFSFYFFLCKYL